MTQAQIAATIAYSMDAAGFTVEERRRMAVVFADELRLTGNRRTRFLNDCWKASEQEARTNLAAIGYVNQFDTPEEA